MFDLGARAFEGIRNASRMDEHEVDVREGIENDNDSYPGSEHQRGSPPQHRSNSNVTGSSRHHEGRSPSNSPVAPAGRKSNRLPSSSLGGWGGIGGGGGEGGSLGGGSALLATRARPPRSFGPSGEMDAFTWDAAVAQAILRAVMRDDEDVPSERLERLHVTIHLVLWFSFRDVLVLEVL